MNGRLGALKSTYRILTILLLAGGSIAATESGTVTVFQEVERNLRPLGQINMPHAHTVSVDPKTHLVYFPLQNIDGHPLLRIMQPARWALR